MSPAPPEIAFRLWGFPQPAAIHPLSGGQSGARVWRVDLARAHVGHRDSPPYRVPSRVVLRCERPGRPATSLIAERQQMLCVAASHDELIFNPDPRRLPLPHYYDAERATAGSHAMLANGVESSVWTDSSGCRWTVEAFVAGEPTLSERLGLLPDALARLGVVHARIASFRGRHLKPRRRLSPTIAERIGVAESLPPDAHPMLASTLRRLREQAGEVCDQHAIWKDLWAAHVLIGDDDAIGFIDAGAASVDHWSVDIARLLGSLPPIDADLREAALVAYAEARAPKHRERKTLLTAANREGIDVLERSGVLLASLRWQRRGEHPLKAERLRQLGERMAAWSWPFEPPA